MTFPDEFLFDECLKAHIESVLNCTLPQWDAFLLLDPWDYEEHKPASECKGSEKYDAFNNFYEDVAVSSEQEIYLKTGCQPKCKAGPGRYIKANLEIK